MRVTPGANPATDPPVLTVEYGPYFGTGSPAANQPSPADRLYDDVHFYDYRVPNKAKLEASRPPLFMDVAVQHTSGGVDRLYAAVDTCGVVAFDLSAGWSDQLLPLASPGTVLPIGAGTYDSHGNETSERIVQLDPAARRNWMRRLAFLDTGTGQYLAAASYPSPLERYPHQRNEGRLLNAHGDRHSGLKASLSEIYPSIGGGGRGYTVVWDVGSGAWPSATGRSLLLGGQEVVLPPVQGGSESILLCGTGSSVPPETLQFGADPDTSRQPPSDGDAFTTFRAQLDWQDPGNDVVSKRQAVDRPGRWCYYPGVSAIDERVLIPASNDGGFSHDGALWTCGGAVLRDPASSGNDPAMHGGVYWNPKAQWGDPGNGIGYYWSLGASKWRMQEYSVGAGLCGAQPVVPAPVKKIYVLSPADRFNDTGRGYYSGGGLSADYDQYVQTLTGDSNIEIVFGSRMGTDWGIVVMRRDQLQAALDGTGTHDGDPVDPDQFGALLGILVTHPEYVHVADYDGNASPTNEKAISATLDLEGHTATFSPEFVELPTTPSGPPNHHVLIVPCGAVAVDSSDLTNANLRLTDTQNPVPAPFEGKRDHPMVRLFDISVANINDFDQSGSSSVDAYTLIGPLVTGLAEGAAVEVETAVVEGRTWLFVTDFAGALLVYDISDLLIDHPEGRDFDEISFPPAAQYVPPADFTDEFPSNVWGLAVDQPAGAPLYVYLGVSRVGVVVLEFVPPSQGGPNLIRRRLVQTPGETMGLWVRTDPDSAKRQLIVANTYGGLRFFDYEQ